MPRGSKAKYSAKQKRMAAHIEEGYEARGAGEEEAERRAWATVNERTGGAGGGARRKSKAKSSRKRASAAGGTARPKRKATRKAAAKSASKSARRKTARKTTGRARKQPVRRSRGR